MPSAAKAAKGTKLQVGNGGGPETFTTIAEVLDVKAPNESQNTIEVTSHDSTAAEFIAEGIVDGGEVTFGLNFIGSNPQHQGLRADLRNGTLRNFKLLIPDKTLDADKTTFSFSGIVTAFDGPEAPVRGKLQANVTIKISGLPTVAYAAA